MAVLTCAVMCRPVEAMKNLNIRNEHPALLPDMPLCVLHGTDSFHSIAMPDGAPITDARNAVTAWAAALSKLDDNPHAVVNDPQQQLASLPAEASAHTVTCYAAMCMCNTVHGTDYSRSSICLQV
jgi:hypothetical protein